MYNYDANGHIFKSGFHIATSYAIRACAPIRPIKNHLYNVILDQIVADFYIYNTNYMYDEDTLYVYLGPSAAIALTPNCIKMSLPSTLCTNMRYEDYAVEKLRDYMRDYVRQSYV